MALVKVASTGRALVDRLLIEGRARLIDSGETTVGDDALVKLPTIAA